MADQQSHQLSLGLDVGPTAADMAAPVREPARRERDRSAALRRLDDHPQTRLKLDALRGYYPEWLRILGRVRGVTDLYVIDAFAGPGTYPDGADERGWSEGSPLIACAAARQVQEEFATDGRTLRIHVRLVDRRRGYCRTLEGALRGFKGVVDFEVIPGKAEELLPRLLAESKGHPTLVFLDPDGFRQLSMDMVRSCWRPYTELLISFDVQGAIRTAATRDSSAVTSFYGDDMWRRMRAEDGTILVSEFLEGYRVRLGRTFPRTTLKRILYNANHANRAIVQGCGSERGVEVWGRAFAAAERPDDVQVFEFVTEDIDRAKVDAALVLLKTLAGNAMTYGTIRQTIGGLDLGAELTHQALLFLRAQGVLTWTSTLHPYSRPRPWFTFAPDFPAGLTWDATRRPRERAMQSAVDGA